MDIVVLVEHSEMVKAFSIITIILMLGISAASAQPNDDVTCDPYRLGMNDFTVTADDLTAPADNEIDAFAMREIGINPNVLMNLADSINGSPARTPGLGDPRTRLAPSLLALVTRDDAPLNLYEGACTDSEVLARLMKGTRVVVLDGPVDADGFAWWRVRDSDLTGWVIEGMDSDIWLTGER